MLSITNHQKKFKSKPIENNKYWWRWEIEILTHYWWDCKMLMNTMEKQLCIQAPQNKTAVWFHFRVSPKELKAGLLDIFVHPCHSSTIYNSPDRRNPPRVQSGMNGEKMWYTHTMEYYSALRRKSRATTWMNLEDVMLRERT